MHFLSVRCCYPRVHESTFMRTRVHRYSSHLWHSSLPACKISYIISMYVYVYVYIYIYIYIYMYKFVMLLTRFLLRVPGFNPRLQETIYVPGWRGIRGIFLNIIFCFCTRQFTSIYQAVTKILNSDHPQCVCTSRNSTGMISLLIHTSDIQVIYIYIYIYIHQS